MISKEQARSPKMAIIYLLLTFLLGFGVPALIPSEAGIMLSNVGILVIIFGAGYLKGTGTKDIGLIAPRSWSKTISLGLLYSLVIFLVFRITIGPLLEIMTGEERDLSRFDYLVGNTPALFQTILMLWIMAGFIEEVVFRGFMISNTAAIFKNSKTGWYIGVAFSSFLFAVVHGYQGISGILLTGLAGLFFGLLFLKHKNNLWILVIAHGVTDMSAAILIYFDVYEEVSSFLF